MYPEENIRQSAPVPLYDAHWLKWEILELLTCLLWYVSTYNTSIVLPVHNKLVAELEQLAADVARVVSGRGVHVHGGAGPRLRLYLQQVLLRRRLLLWLLLLLLWWLLTHIQYYSNTLLRDYLRQTCACKKLFMYFLFYVVTLFWWSVLSLPNTSW